MNARTRHLAHVATAVLAAFGLVAAPAASASEHATDDGPSVHPPDVAVANGHDRFGNGLSDDVVIRTLDDGRYVTGTLVTQVLEETAADGSMRASVWAQVFQDVCDSSGACQQANTLVIEGEIPRSAFTGDWDGLNWAALDPVAVPSRLVTPGGTVMPSPPVEIAIRWDRDPQSAPVDYRTPWAPEVNGDPVPYLSSPDDGWWCSTHVKEAAVRRAAGAFGHAELVLDGHSVMFSLDSSLLADHLTHQATITRDAVVYSHGDTQVVGGLAVTDC